MAHEPLADAGALWRALETAADAAAFEDAFAALADEETPAVMTPRTLALAVRAGAPDAVRLLLTHGRVRPHDGLVSKAVRLPEGPAAAVTSALVRLGGLAVNAAGADGWTPLHEAAAHGAGASVVTALLQLGADPRAVSSDGATPAVAAARANNAAALRALAAAGVPVLGGGSGGPAVDDGAPPSPLTAALEALAGSALRALLQLPRPPSPPLCPTVRGGRLPALHWLVDQPAPLRFALAPADAAAVAAEAAAADAARLDGSYGGSGSDGGAPTLSGPCSPSAAAERPPSAYRLSPPPPPTIFTSAVVGKASSPSALVSGRQPPRPPPSPLDAAPPPSLLLLDGFDLDAAGGGDGCDNADAAAKCADASHVNVLRWLLAAGAAPDVRDAQDRTPLHAACARLDAPAAAVLLAAGADATALDAAGAAPHECVPVVNGAAAATAASTFLRAFASSLDAAGWTARAPPLVTSARRALAAADSAAAAFAAAARTTPLLVGRPGLSVLAVTAAGGR